MPRHLRCGRIFKHVFVGEHLDLGARGLFGVNVFWRQRAGRGLCRYCWEVLG